MSKIKAAKAARTRWIPGLRLRRARPNTSPKNPTEPSRSPQASTVLGAAGVLASLAALVIATLAYQQQVESETKQFSHVHFAVQPFSDPVLKFPDAVRMVFFNRGPAIAGQISAKYKCPWVARSTNPSCVLVAEPVPGGVELDVRKDDRFTDRYILGVKNLPPGSSVTVIVRTGATDTRETDDIHDLLAEPLADSKYFGRIELAGDKTVFSVEGAWNSSWYSSRGLR